MTKNTLADEVTPKSLFLTRRDWLKAAGISMAALPAMPMSALAASPYATDEPQTPLESITNYNNYYEFTTEKEGVADLVPPVLGPRPWMVEVGGLCAKPQTLALEHILATQKIVDRIYRLRCVEGWSMVIPWRGFELGAFLQQFQPNSEAKYVAFETLLDPAQMPGQKSNILRWPYVEGLRLDEAMHPLTLLASGLYGEDLLTQNGAPLRLVVPWKYGFKSIKSIVKITFTADQPPSSWNLYAPREYGFYSNVNPDVDHPRWSQSRERRLGEFFKRETLMFNGYEDQVADLYRGMDLKANF